MENNCLDCGKKISSTAKRCPSCCQKGNLNHAFGKKPKSFLDRNYCCMECGDLITRACACGGNGRCKKCASKLSYHMSIGKIHKLKGKDHPNYRGIIRKCVDCGIELKTRNNKQKRCLACHYKLIKAETRYCCDCGKEIGKNKQSVRCLSCNNKYQWKIGNRNINGLLKAHKVHINKYAHILTEDFLVENYINKSKGATEIANMVGCYKTTIYRYLKRFSITIRTNSESHIGQKVSEEQKEKYRTMFNGENNPNWQGGKIKVKCIICNKDIFKDKNETINKNVFLCSGPCRSEYCKAKFSGEGNANWLGGISHYGYPWYFNDKLKEEIRKRDGYVCQKCNNDNQQQQRKTLRKLDVHHIDYNKDNCKKSNLITLCGKCNVKANYNRDYWFAYYTYIMENTILKGVNNGINNLCKL